MSAPRVMIGIPTYKRPERLRVALESVLDQTYQDWCAVISDNANDAGTREVVESFADPRLRYVAQPTNLLFCANTNYLLAASDTDYTCILHDDDRYLPEYVETLAGALDGRPEVAWAFCNGRYISDAGSRARLFVSNEDDELFARGSRLARHLMRMTCVLPDAFMARRTVIERYRYSPDLQYAPDRYFYLELALGHDGFYVARPLVEYHEWAGGGRFHDGTLAEPVGELRFLDAVLSRTDVGKERAALRADRPERLKALLRRALATPAAEDVSLNLRCLQGLPGWEMALCRWLLRHPLARRVILQLPGAKGRPGHTATAADDAVMGRI